IYIYTCIYTYKHEGTIEVTKVKQNKPMSRQRQENNKKFKEGNKNRIFPLSLFILIQIQSAI
ncbi:hypothetical protein DU74_02530, partial [Methanosarcina mazei]